MDFGPDNPFTAADKILKESTAKITLVDMHCEATSEKLAMGYHLDGRVSAVWGTHTHVQTSDAGVFPKGTGYITDLGMTGPAVSILGIRPEQSISMFMGNPRRPYQVAQGAAKIECCIFEIDADTGLCTGAEALRIS
jgi:calcineurin-like phosphoesterase